MPFNLLKEYNAFLELEAFTENERKISLKGVFDRDFANNPNLCFKQKTIKPTPKDGEIPMNTLFTHLTTEVTDKNTKQRTFEIERSKRLHWVKHHLEERMKQNMLHFSVKEPEGIRTYIYDISENYVIVLEPFRNSNEYYLITAYYLRGKDSKRNKILQKYNKRRLSELH